MPLKRLDWASRDQLLAARVAVVTELERNVELFDEADQRFVRRLIELRDAGGSTRARAQDLAALTKKQVVRMESLLQSVHEANEGCIGGVITH